MTKPTLTRTQIASCPNELTLVELHRKVYPEANAGTSKTFALRVMEGRKCKKVREPREVKPHWNN